MGEHSKPQQKKTPSETGRRPLLVPKKGLESQKQVKAASARHHQRTGVPEGKPKDGPVEGLDPIAASRQRHQARISQGASSKAVPILAKLEVGGMHDPLEAEADQVADFVTRNKAPKSQAGSGMPSAIVRRAPKPVDSVAQAGVEAPVRRKSKGKGKAADAAPGQGFEAQLKATKGRGKGLDKATRGNLESKLDTPLGHVQVHQDSEADSLSSEIGAKAFAHGNDIYFRKGHYQPHTPAGQHLIAHEVWHTLQGQGQVMRKAGEQLLQRAKTIQETAAQILQLSGIHLSNERMEAKLESILQSLFTLDNQAISAVWREVNGVSLQRKFFKMLELQHYTAYPREIALSFRAFEERPIWVAEILDQHVKKKTPQKKGLDGLKAARVLFLSQGASYPIMNEQIPAKAGLVLRAHREYGYLLAGLKDDLKEDYKAFSTPVKEKDDPDYDPDDRIPLHSEKLDSAISDRIKTNQKVLKTVIEIKAILPQWGATGYTTPILPYQAVGVCRLLRKLDDATRDELLKRYPDDFANVQLNYPADAKTGYRAGIDPTRGASEKTLAYLIKEFCSDQNWEYDPDAVVHLQLLLDLTIQAGLAQEVASTVNAHLGSKILASDPLVLDKVLYILQDAATTKGEPTWKSVAENLIRPDVPDVQEVQKKYRIENGHVLDSPIKSTASKEKQPLIKSDYSMLNAVYGFVAASQQARMAQKRAERQAWRESVTYAKQTGAARPVKARGRDAAAHTSEVDEIIQFALSQTNDPGLVLKDLPLAKLAYHLGGDLMGARLDEQRVKAENGGLLDAVIGPSNASIRSELLPFSSINYEMGSSHFKSYAAVFKGLSGTFDYHDTVIRSEDKKAKGKTKRIEARSVLQMESFEMQGLELVDHHSFLGIGKIALKGLKIEINQPLVLAGPVAGGYGMNILFAIIGQVNNIMFLAMDTLMTTLDPFMPDAKLFAGQEMSDLLVSSFNSDPSLTIYLESAEIQDIASESSNTMRKVNLGSSTISIGGSSMLEQFKQKAAQLASLGTMSPEDHAKQIFYADMIRMEEDRLKAHEEEVSCLREKMAKAQTEEEWKEAKRDLEIELRKNRLLVAATLNDISLLSGDRNAEGEFESLPAPTGRIDLLAELDAPGIGQLDFERAELELKAALGILDGKDAIPPSGLNRDRLYIEFGNPQLPTDLNQSMQASMGMDINRVMPGWAGIKLSMLNSSVWKLEAFTSRLRINSFPTLESMEICSVDKNQAAYIDLHSPTITALITFNSFADQRKKGLAPQVVDIQSIKAESLVGANATISVSGIDIFLEKSIVLREVALTDLQLRSSDGFESYEVDTNGLQFRGNKIEVNQLIAGMGIDGIGGVSMDMSNYHGKNLFFKMINSESEDGLVSVDTMLLGFNEGTGPLTQFGIQNKNYGLGLDYVEYLNTTTTTHRTANPNEKEKEDNICSQKVVHKLRSEIGQMDAQSLNLLYKSMPKAKAPAAKSGDGAKGFVFAIRSIGNTSEPEVDIKKIIVDLNATTLREETAEIPYKDAEAKLVGLHVNSLWIESVHGKDLEVDINGLELQFRGQTAIEGLYLEDFDLDMGGERAKIRQLAKVGYNSAFFEEVVYGALNLRNARTGAATASKIKGQDGYAISIQDILGEIDLHGVQGGRDITLIKAMLDGDGVDVSATYLTSGLVNATVTLKDGLTISELNYKTADGEMALSLARGESANISDVSLELEVKLRPNDKKNPIEYIRLKNYHIGSITAKGLKVKMGGMVIETQQRVVTSDEDPKQERIEHESITILNVNGTESSYNFLNSKAIVNSTAGLVSGALKFKMQGVLAHPIVDLKGLSFGMDKEGKIELGVIESNVAFPQFDPKAKPGTLNSKGQDFVSGDFGKLRFGQLDKISNLIYAQKTHMIMEKIDTKGDYSPDNLRISYEMQDPQINGLVLDLKGKPLEAGMPPLNGYLKLTGQIKGMLTVKFQQEGRPTIVISTPDSKEDDFIVGNSGIVISDGELVLEDYKAVLSNQKPVPDPTFTEEKSEEIEAKNKELLENYEYDSKFDIFDALIPTKDGGGQIGLGFLGGYAGLEIEDVLVGGDVTKHGYLNLTKVCEQLDKMVDAFINTYAEFLPDDLPTTELIRFYEKDNKVFLGLTTKGEAVLAAILAAIPMIWGAIKGGALGGPVGAVAGAAANVGVSMFAFVPLFLALKALNLSYLICDDIGPFGFIERGGGQFLSISRLVNYQVFSLTQENPRPATLSPAEKAMDQIQTYYGLADSQPFGVYLKGMKFDLDEVKRRESNSWLDTLVPKPVYLNRISDLFANEEGDQLNFSLLAGINGGNDLGPVFKLFDFESGEIQKAGEIATGSYSSYLFKTSGLKIGEISVVNPDVHSKQVTLKLKDIEPAEFYLELTKRKAEVPAPNHKNNFIPFYNY